MIATDRLLYCLLPRGESVIRTGAPRLAGRPRRMGRGRGHRRRLLGFVQSVYWMHGIALPRDSDLQAHIGTAVEPGRDGAGCASVICSTSATTAIASRT